MSIFNLIYFRITQNLSFFYYDRTLQFKFLPRTRRILKRHQQLIEKLHSFTESVINERKLKSLENFVDDFGSKKKLAFLDLLLQSRVDGKPLDDEGIREEVDTFMFEGHDTTTSGIAFALLNLAKNPKIQDRVLDECRVVLGDKKTATMQDLNQLNYLEKFIKESFRLFPPVSLSIFVII